MPQAERIVEIEIISFDHIDPGVTFVYVLEFSAKLYTVKAPVEGIVHPGKSNTSIYVIITKAIANVKENRDVFAGGIGFGIKCTTANPGTTKIKRLIHCSYWDQVP